MEVSHCFSYGMLYGRTSAIEKGGLNRSVNSCSGNEAIFVESCLKNLPNFREFRTSGGRTALNRPALCRRNEPNLSLAFSIPRLECEQKLSAADERRSTPIILRLEQTSRPACVACCGARTLAHSWSRLPDHRAFVSPA
jgi:hypothetical protein